MLCFLLHLNSYQFYSVFVCASDVMGIYMQLVHYKNTMQTGIRTAVAMAALPGFYLGFWVSVVPPQEKFRSFVINSDAIWEV